MLINMGTKKVLLIEDNEDNRTLVKFALESNTDWKIIVATNGVEGITKAELERPDVILLDLVMPNLDGVTVAEVLKCNRLTCSIPIIVMTAMIQPKLFFQLETTLAKGIITKPFDPVNLDSQIAKICNWELVSKKKINLLI